MSFNYNKLDGKITEQYGTRGSFAKALGVSERTLSLKMNGHIAWKQSEISKACTVLGIKTKDIPIYFFTEQVYRW